MSNKFVALLLLACIVTVQSETKIVSPEECYDYCYRAMFMPKLVAENACKWRCRNFNMYESVNQRGTMRGKIQDFSDPTASPAKSPVPKPKVH
ncbi:unnamed protein product [Lathyrus sativus]|nr:unnamed protein product [Lathyrus sativus]